MTWPSALDNGGAGLELVQRPVPQVLAALPFAADGGLAEQVVRHEENRWPRPSRCGGHERSIHVVIDPLGRAHATDPFRAAGEQALVVQFLEGITPRSRRVHLLHDRYYGRAGLQCLGQRRHEQCGGGTVLTRHHTGAPRYAGIPVGHCPARVLLPVRHLPDPPVLDREQHRRRDALSEDHFHLMALQRGGYLIGDCGLMASHLYYTSIALAVSAPREVSWQTLQPRLVEKTPKGIRR